MRISDWSSDVCSSDLIGKFDQGRNFLATLGQIDRHRLRTDIRRTRQNRIRRAEQKPARGDREQFSPSHHRSHSPNTTSIAPMIAVVSARMCLLALMSLLCVCENAGAQILQVYGVVVLSLTSAAAHTSALLTLVRIATAIFCVKK